MTAASSHLLGGKVPWHLREEAVTRVLAHYQDFCHLLGDKGPCPLRAEVTLVLICYRDLLAQAVQTTGLIVLVRCQPRDGMVICVGGSVEAVPDGERYNNLEANRQRLQLLMFLVFVGADPAQAGGSRVVAVFGAAASVRVFDRHAT